MSMSAVTGPFLQQIQSAIVSLDEQNAKAIDEIQATLTAATNARNERMTQIRKLRDEANRLRMEADNKEALAEDSYGQALASIRAALAEIRPADVPGQRLKAAQ